VYEKHHGGAMITGEIKSGVGLASKIKPEVFTARREASKVDLLRGTLNVRVDDLEAAIASLGGCHFKTDTDNTKNGALRWWNVLIHNDKLHNQMVKAFVVRHEITITKYLEIMSHFNFRDNGFKDGEKVSIELKGPGDNIVH
jgi:CTP-dependent riboflavin kinase